MKGYYLGHDSEVLLQCDIKIFIRIDGYVQHKAVQMTEGSLCLLLVTHSVLTHAPPDTHVHSPGAPAFPVALVTPGSPSNPVVEGNVTVKSGNQMLNAR